MRSVELIELGLNEIARDCRIIDDVAIESKYAASQRASDETNTNTIEIFERIAKRHESVLKEVHEKVRDLMEFVGEYMNGQDMVSGVDVAISKTIYDLVYERTTDEDYENHEQP
jgi:signal transduction histidine kinase